MACALELIHSGSLALDDCSCMDNAKVRHGKPSCHKQYGEALTVLASFGLLYLADVLIAEAAQNHNLSIKEVCQLTEEVKNTTLEMINGQVIDLISTGRRISGRRVRGMYTSKAGSLYSCAAVAPAILLRTEDPNKKCLRKFGKLLGFTYQIYDDILDVVGDPKTLGKAVGQDKGKNTFVSCYGLKKTKTLAEEAKQQCLRTLDLLGERADILRSLVECIFWIRV